MLTKVSDSPPVTTDLLCPTPPSWLVAVQSCAQAAFLSEEFLFPFHVLAQAQEILYTGSHFTLDHRDPLYCKKDRNTPCHYVTAKSVGKLRDGFIDGYLELRSQHPLSLKTDSVHQVSRMRDEHKVQHLPGVLTQPKKQFTGKCITKFSGTSCIQSSMLELGHFIIFFIISLERLSLFLRVSSVIQDVGHLNLMPIASYHEFSTTYADRRYCVVDDISPIH